MKVDKILPCVCCDHEPNSGDSVYYGLPLLEVFYDEPDIFFSAYCPVCGRGSYSVNSAYLALEHWNNLQVKALRYKNSCKGVEKNANESNRT